jgi:multiple sugar transport system permease protein
MSQAERVSGHRGHDPEVMTSRPSGVRWFENRRVVGGLGLAVAHVILIAGAFFVAIPFFWMLSTSLKDEGSVFAEPIVWIPIPPEWGNYVRALTILPFATYFANSLITTLVPTFGSVLSCSLAAFSFARLRWGLRNVCFLLVLATMMLPYQVTLIPRFLLFRYMGWIDTLNPLVWPPWFAVGAFNVFLLRQFFMTIPQELDDAAKIDGASILEIYWRILLPLSKPALAAVVIFDFQAHWDDFLGPLIYLQSPRWFTLPLGLAAFQGQYGTAWNLMMAASVVVMAPILLTFFFLQRTFIQGIVFTGIKG